MMCWMYFKPPKSPDDVCIQHSARLDFLILHHHQRSLAMHITMRLYSASNEDGFCLYQTSSFASQTAIFFFYVGAGKIGSVATPLAELFWNPQILGIF